MKKKLKQIVFTLPLILILFSFYKMDYPIYISIGFIIATYIFNLSSRFDRYEKHPLRTPILYFSGRYIMLLLYLCMVYGGLAPILLFFPDLKGLVSQYHYLIFIGFLLYYTYGYINFKRVKVTEYNIDGFGLDKEYKITFISDMHLDSFKSRDYLSKRVDIINKVEGDIVLIGGDIFDSYESVVNFDYISEFKGIDKPCYYIWGNHDYRGDIDISRKKLEEAGLILLEDQGINIDNNLYLIGRQDQRVRNRKSIKEINGDNQLPILLLDHKPIKVEEVAKNNNIKLQLSGHTHRGQIFPVTILYSFLYDINYGRKKINNTNFIVSQGSGAAFTPFRVFTNNEILSINIK